MEQQYSSQFNCVCLVLDGTEKAKDVIEAAEAAGAVYVDEDGKCYVLQFPKREVKELYTALAIRRSLRHNG
jgi:hypothetical protein